MNDPQPTTGMPTRLKIAYAASALWILLGSINGLAGVVIAAALLALGVGIAALVVGRARWAFIANRKVGGVVVGGALVAAMIGGAASASLADEDDTSARADTSPSASASAEPTASETPTVSPSPTATETAEPAPADPDAATTVTVTDVVDGDTVDVSTGETIRIIGIDTPERGVCGYSDATDNMEALVLGQPVTLTPGARDDVDKYGRLLRYVDVNGVDAGLDQINKGLAIARYDSRDGYGAHTREQQYVAADAASADYTCQPSQPAPAQPPTQAAPPPPEPVAPAGCHPTTPGRACRSSMT